MRLPPEPVLVAARRWLDILPTSGGIPRAQALLHVHPDYSDLSPTQYATALSWLRDCRLLDPAGQAAPSPQRVLAAIFEHTPPAWVQDADDLVRSPDELPADIISAGESLGLDPEAVYQQLVSSWGKVDAAARAEVGAAGERALVRLLRAHPSARVDHVSTWSDGFGYDIRFQHEAALGHLEVKSSTRAGRFTVYLSRHEYRVMQRDVHWLLVLVKLKPDHELSGVGTVPRDWVEENVPSDRGPHGSWASVKFDVPADVVRDGIPHLYHSRDVNLPRWHRIPTI